MFMIVGVNNQSEKKIIIKKNERSAQQNTSNLYIKMCLPREKEIYLHPCIYGSICYMRVLYL